MLNDSLRKAREFEKKYLPHLSKEELPQFHVTGEIGWINDPNGFSVYKDEYHLFFQYHPYDVKWGPMHWGHVKTKDFIHWERLPVALAPDEEYDKDGCFSGSAIELPDGRHLLMYTGVRNERREDGKMEFFQTQFIAVGDGVDYEKYALNPVSREMTSRRVTTYTISATRKSALKTESIMRSSETVPPTAAVRSSSLKALTALRGISPPW